MAIKVRHDGNAAATAVAGAGSGTAKRRVETAKLAQNTTQHVQTLSPAHASAPGASAPGIMGAGHATAPSAGGGSAPLTHAPNGASGASAPLTHAPSPTGGGGAGSRSSSLRGSGAGGDLGEVKVTGTSIFERPDKESQWNPSTMRWERPWLPGEKEAEAAQRMNPVLAEREQFRHGEGLGEIVVRTLIQSFHAVPHLGFRREHHDRHLVPVRANLGEHLPAAHPRHHHVEENRVVLVAPEHPQRLDPVSRDIHGEAALLQDDAHGTGKVELILG